MHKQEYTKNMCGYVTVCRISVMHALWLFVWPKLKSKRWNKCAIGASTLCNPREVQEESHSKDTNSWCNTDRPQILLSWVIRFSSLNLSFSYKNREPLNIENTPWYLNRLNKPLSHTHIVCTHKNIHDAHMVTSTCNSVCEYTVELHCSCSHMLSHPNIANVLSHAFCGITSFTCHLKQLHSRPCGHSLPPYKKWRSILVHVPGVV